MKNIEIVRHKQRLDHLFDKGGSLTDLEIQAHWARYLCVLASGFIEFSVREIYRNYARGKAAPNVVNYVDGRLKVFRNPNMEKILQLTNLFSAQWEEQLRATVEGQPKAAIDSIVANRNSIAHGQDVGITFARVKDYYQSALEVISALEKQVEN